MLCNANPKNKQNSARTQCASFFLPLFLFFILQKRKMPRMKYMNVMQCKSQRQKGKTQKPKNNGHKGKSNEAQGPRKPR